MRGGIWLERRCKRRRDREMVQRVRKFGGIDTYTHARTHAPLFLPLTASAKISGRQLLPRYLTPIRHPPRVQHELD